MAQISDNISVDLLPALKATLAASTGAAISSAISPRYQIGNLVCKL